MGVTVRWDDDDKTILRLTYQGEWSIEELGTAGLEAIELVSSVAYRVYVINDFRLSAFPPLGALWEGRQLTRMRPANWAGGAIIVRDSVIKNLLDIFMHVYLGPRFQDHQFIVSSDEQARAVITRLKQEKVV